MLKTKCMILKASKFKKRQLDMFYKILDLLDIEFYKNYY